jgi:hypothetical protein
MRNDTSLIKPQTSSSVSETATEQEKVWIIVSQVKSHRVVYFTDDMSYRPPTQGDWYHVSQHRGSLPAGMTLRNCWGWRYRGLTFIDARDKSAANPTESLLKHNKKALRELLLEKIKSIRQSVSSPSLYGDEIRQMRLHEAKDLLAGQQLQAPSLLTNSAAIRGISLQEMARRTVAAFERQQHVFIQSEMLQDQLLASIDACIAQEQLMSIRAQIISDIAPEINAKYKIKPEHTTPQKIKQVLTPDEIAHERLRLTAELRLKINALRQPFFSEYLLDDVVMQHKMRMAQAVIAQQGKAPEGQDILLLVSHAAARQQTLLQAAHDVLSETNQSVKIIMESEQLKDAFLAKISSAQSHQDFEKLSQLMQTASLGKQSAKTSSDDKLLPSTKT